MQLAVMPAAPAPHPRNLCSLLLPLQLTGFIKFQLFYYVCAGYTGLVVVHAVSMGWRGGLGGGPASAVSADVCRQMDCSRAGCWRQPDPNTDHAS